MSGFFRKLVRLGKKTGAAIGDDHASSMAAALAYYTFFSIAPLLLIAIAIAGLLFGREAAQGEVSKYLSGMIGQSSAETIESMIKSASGQKKGTLAAILGTVATLFGATGVFASLQESLNIIWKAPKLKIPGILAFFRARMLSLAVVLGIGFLLLVSLLAGVALNAVCELWGQCDQGWGKLLNEAMFFAFASVLFGMIFKLLPDVKVDWRNVWLGAVLTGVMFTVGKHVLTLVLAKSSLSTYGTAASLAGFLLWVYYSAMILFAGAEFTHQVAEERKERHRIRAPSEDEDEGESPHGAVPA
jgi:membrane protein